MTTLTSNNPRITNVAINKYLNHLIYFVDERMVETWGDFLFITDPITGEYKGVCETATIYRSECYDEDGLLIDEVMDKFENDGIIEEISFEAYFDN